MMGEDKVYFDRPDLLTKAPERYTIPKEEPPSLPGIGGAPTRNTTMPKDDAARKAHPVATGFLDYFPDAVPLVAHLSFMANEKHNPGQPLHWARGKSTDEPDTLERHFLARGTFDDDGFLHDVKIAWRALANLQKEIEQRVAAGLPICKTHYYTGAKSARPGSKLRVYDPQT